MLWIFSREKRQLRELVRLSEKTIARMDELLRQPMKPENKGLIETHLAQRKDELFRYKKSFKGAADEWDAFENHLLMGIAENSRAAMLHELKYFMSSADEFAEYIVAIRPHH